MGILKEERDLVIESRALEATEFQVEDIRWAYVFYESGLSQAPECWTFARLIE